MNRIEKIISVKNRDALAALNDIGSSIRQNLALGTLFGNALTSGIVAVTNAAKGLVGQFGQLADLQIERVGMAGDLARATGFSFAGSQKDMESFTE